MSELEQMIGDVINASAESVRVGMRAERARLLPALQAIFMAFDRAQEDAGAKLPSSLTTAIVAARSVVGPLMQEQARGR